MDKYYSEIPDALWQKIASFIPKEKVNPQGGAIVYLQEW
ncbi:hypothetical protein LEP1GSC062_3768 [Leptospira alexanderi serovar Manhao 3 str. L 60]|uniref:Uncharacterized protein n=1 Tax=Leptospira alexanderi serovar Manhao 3 str. L 60 TaxID=1049759 RepID=V6HYR1_9LEPT|nr:hypothetical protein LEP1GSC062_3768 [Leptospira alexanderi serovar Manhao 3 str. L 60]